MQTFDMIVIGTGGATIVADAALKHGLSVAVIERDKFGGTCANRGCIPTKFMVTAADAVREIETFKAIGVDVAPASINWDIMSRRVWDVIDNNVHTRDYYKSLPGCTVFEGTASFVSDKVINVTHNDDGLVSSITAPLIVIGTGAESKVNDIPGLEAAGYLTSESLFGDKYPARPPKRLVIMGGGPIGVEFAHVFAAAGTEVHLVQHNVRLLPKEDADISEHIYRELTLQGIHVYLNQSPKEVRTENGEKILTIQNRTTGELLTVSGDEILMASGIKPATKELLLENTGIETNRGGWIRTNECLETTVEGIYALGDVNGEAPFRHKSNYEADIIAHNLFRAASLADRRWARYDVVPAVTYSYPQVGHVGLTETEAREKGFDVGIGINRYSASAKGAALGLEADSPHDGFAKIVVDKTTNRILGIHVVGPQASVLFQPFVNLMNSGDTPLQIINEDIAWPDTAEMRKLNPTRTLDPHSVISVGETMAPHPALSEFIMWTQVYYEQRW